MPAHDDHTSQLFADAYSDLIERAPVDTSAGSTIIVSRAIRRPGSVEGTTPVTHSLL